MIKHPLLVALIHHAHRAHNQVDDVLGHGDGDQGDPAQAGVDEEALEDGG